jgi:hypothetical protein
MVVGFNGVPLIVAQDAAQARAEAVRAVMQSDVARTAGQEAAARAQADVERALREAQQQVERAQRDAERAQRDAERAVRDAEREARDAVREAQAGQPVPPPWVQDFPGGPQIPEGAVIMTVAFFVMCAVIAIGLPLARAFARRMDKRAVAPLADNDTRLRLERIEHAVDAIAIEVERISEGQRFTSKLLSDVRGLPEKEAAESGGAPVLRARERR